MDSTTIATCALVVSVFSTGLAVWTAFLQRRHMVLSVRPIAAIPVADFEDRVGVFIKNVGLGPMTIKSLRVSSREGATHDDVISHMPRLKDGVHWSNFWDAVDGATLENGKRFELLLLKGEPSHSKFRESRDAVRRALSTLTVRVEYEDLYGQTMKPHDQELSWFGRHEGQT